MASDTERAPGWPWERDAGGAWPMASGNDLLAQEVKQAILIGKGERPMLKDVGSTLSRLLFSLEGEQRDAVATEYSRQAVHQSVPRVYVDAVVIEETTTNTGTQLVAKVDYRETGSAIPGHLEFPFEGAQA